MAGRKYFVNNGQAAVGPFEMNVIIEKVNAGELKATDSICVNVDNDEWILICQHDEFTKHFKPAKPHKSENKSEPAAKQASQIVMPQNLVIPAAPPAAQHGGVEVLVSAANGPAPSNGAAAMATMPSQEAFGSKPTATETGIKQPLPETAAPFTGDLTTSQWYVLKGKNRFGPFMYLDVVRMLQEKSVFEFDYVWAQGLDKWKRIAELDCFSAEHIRALFGQDNAESVFYRRSHPRARYETSLICHDNNNVWKGHTIEISEGGAGVIIQNALLLPGQSVYMHFRPGPLSKSFNVLSEVVSKRYMKGIKEPEAPVLYGIKFINIQKQDREALRNIHTAA